MRVLDQAEMVAVMTPPWLGHPLGPPMVVHCSAGIGRTGIVILVIMFRIYLHYLHFVPKTSKPSPFNGMRKYVKPGIMIVIGDIVNITVLILIVIVSVTGTFCTLDIAIRKFEATEKVGNFKVCKNLSQISH